MMVGPSVGLVAQVCSIFYGMYQFSDSNYVSNIVAMPNGQLKITVKKTILTSYDIITDVQSVRSVVALGQDDMGADDCEGNVIEISKYFIEGQENELLHNGVF